MKKENDYRRNYNKQEKTEHTKNYNYKKYIKNNCFTIIFKTMLTSKTVFQD
jgi:hypothetical protein